MIGKAVYYAYYRPLSLARHIKKSGGLINYYQIKKGEQAMHRAAPMLTAQVNETPARQVHFLTGKKYWPLTTFCLYSLLKVTGGKVQPVIVDDGTLDAGLNSHIQRQFPGCIIKPAAETEARLQLALPTSKFPLLQRKRKIYPHIKKLTDIHAGSTGWKLVLDSDMLFFRYPSEMMEWLSTPHRPFFLCDRVCSYHYSFGLMEKLTNRTVTPNLNVGVAGLKSEDIDWERLEYWIGVLEQSEGASYLLEQALSAMLAAGQSPLIANQEDYIVMPDKEEVMQNHAVLHHYVAGSKEWYYKEAWKQVY